MKGTRQPQAPASYTLAKEPQAVIEQEATLASEPA
jgi:hypothetical protein